MAALKCLVCISLLGMTGAPLAAAQNYPQRPVRLIVPFPPGGGVDVPARLLASRLSDAMGRQFVIDNRSGANSIIGTHLAAKATPDGYTLLMVPGGHAINPALYPKLPYDTLRDFAPVSLVANGAYVFTTTKALSSRALCDFIGLATARQASCRMSELDSLIRSELRKWDKMIKALGITAES